MDEKTWQPKARPKYNLKKDVEMTEIPQSDVHDPDDDDDESVTTPPPPPNDEQMSTWAGLKDIFLGNAVNWLLLITPLGLVAYMAGWNDTAVFFFNFFPIIPLAWLLGRATEEVSCRTGQVIGMHGHFRL